MMVLLRILFTGAFVYCAMQARDNARDNLMSGDLTNAFWVGIAVLTAIACAIVWAPYIGGKVADPITGGLTNAEYVERKNRLLQFIRWLEKEERSDRLIRWLCFIEGVRAPWLPTAFNIGLKHSTPGSWLEKVYARELFRFNNTENCMRAFSALLRHGIDPRPHANPDVNAVLLSVERTAAPEKESMPLAAAPPAPPLKRDGRIRIGTD
jgi:hypothetical protein